MGTGATPCVGRGVGEGFLHSFSFYYLTLSSVLILPMASLIFCICSAAASASRRVSVSRSSLADSWQRSSDTTESSRLSEKGIFLGKLCYNFFSVFSVERSK